MKRPLFPAALLVLCLGLLAGCGGPKNLSFTASYTVDADLDPEARSMICTAVAAVTNTGADSADELYFHIYANMYKHLFEDGDVAVTSVADGTGRALNFRRDQEGVLYRVELAEPLGPGETETLTFACEVLIPDLERKYGVSPDGDVQLPSFVPQLAVYREDGWDTDPLPEEGDGRFAAAADYDLTIRVPAAYTLSCNGTELFRREENGTAVYGYHCEDRRDLAVIACKDYVRLERTVGDTAILGYFNETVNGVTVQAAEKVMDWTADALRYFNEILVPYPYDTLIVTNAALGANAAVNMEYPGLITVYFDGQGISSRIAACHEVAHQWFYGLVGNDENREPWLDEGFATFATGLCLDAAGDLDYPYWELESIAANAHEVQGKKVNVPADEAAVYQWVIYDRSAVFLKTLMDTVGEEKFLHILSAYCRENLYGIASTEDFLEALYAGADADVASIVAEYIRE